VGHAFMVVLGIMCALLTSKIRKLVTQSLFHVYYFLLDVKRGFFLQTINSSWRKSNIERNHGCFFHNKEGFMGPPLKNAMIIILTLPTNCSFFLD
jgi:hypothetical protein